MSGSGGRRLRHRGLSPQPARGRKPRPRPRGESVSRPLRADGGRGRRALALPLDLCDRSSAVAALERALDEWGRIDVLVNNAVYVEPASTVPLLEADPEGLLRLLDANVVTQTVLAQRAAEHMLDRGGGRIVNMVSISGREDPRGPAGQGGWAYGYAIHKAALMRMAGVLQVELGERGIVAFSLEPGGVLTEAVKSMFPLDVLKKTFERGDYLVTEDVPAQAVVWLASAPEAAELSGRIIDAETLCRERGLLPDDRIVMQLD
ncbi:MAG: SDR family oxidoreductase [Proteobacteria bacterium]|nr:SDR family oxidoreductase [Pseudomonadota bacterium]